MTLTELQQQVVELPREERFKLAAFLADLEAENEEGFRSEMDRRMKNMDLGVKVSDNEFEARHRDLKANGR